MLFVSTPLRSESCDIRLDSLGSFDGYPGSTVLLQGRWGPSPDGSLLRLTRRKTVELDVVSWTPDAVVVRIPSDTLPGVYSIEAVCVDDETKDHRGKSLPFRVKSIGWRADLRAYLNHPIAQVVVFGIIGIVLLAIIAFCYSRLFPQRAAVDMKRNEERLQELVSEAVALKTAANSVEIPKSLQKYNRDQRRSYLLLGGLVSGGAILGLIFCFAAILAGHASKYWPWTEDSRIFSSYVKRGLSGRNPYYVPTIAYEYRVNGRLYESDRVFFGLPNTSYERAYKLQSEFQPGRPARITYLGFYPAISVLVPGVHRQNFIGIAVALAFLFAGILFLRKSREYEDD